MTLHRKRARRQEVTRLREELRRAEAAGINVRRIGENLKKSAAQIIAECDAELAAVRAAKREG